MATKNLKPFPFSHRELCDKTALWAKRNMNLGLAFVEHKHSMSHEIPDVLGLRADNFGVFSINYEIKVTRSDFLSDKSKPHRNGSVPGIGDYRFYVAPIGTIKPDELPKGWGLIECSHGGRFKVVVGPRDYKCLYSRGSLINSLKNSYHRIYNLDQPSHYRFWGRGQNKTLNNLSFTNPNPNLQDISHLLYAAMRQNVLASDKGLEVNPQLIFQSPFRGVVQTDMRYKT